VAIPSPFHERTSALCSSYRWRDWSGYHAVISFGSYHEREYFAIRHAAGLQDVTPLYKYEVRGPDAAPFLARVMVRDVGRLAVGQVTYCCWCDDRGKLLDDGTVSRLAEDAFRVTAAEPSLWWFHRNVRGFDVSIEDSTARIGVLSLQGPRSRDILEAAADADVAGLGFFRLTAGRVGGVEATITRTGYSGDLGYEIWVAADEALRLWDALIEAGKPHGMLPNGLDALDLARVEAGFLMNGVDYYSANKCLIESRKSTPYESGLGWTVQLKRAPFVGQAALAEEKEQGPARRFVGLEVDWDETEALFEELGLPPEIRSSAWRGSVPVYAPGGAQVGYATSGAWSPLLKRNLALATVAASHGSTGTELRIEMTVEHVRHRVCATVRKKPFFDPERKRA